ncbi:hypothetical protein SAMN04487948_11630 [Halogranum amylolyticum]|uniref:Uncharacterized protein n=1 Tax=Halogranum amylolyticum TaxID=660520 RepID=A0A1H8VEE1_9EURY|nr:hypothetical protein [Halogranum amylolyticum]SEP13826.1 hypothetical protein SAMN04487948_11630 [Halogranum amylolyticum]
MTVETRRHRRVSPARVVSFLRTLVGVLTGLLALSLLIVGTIAVIAELKGTWHWAIHLESTISYMGLFVSWLLVVLVPAFLALVVGRVVVDDA